jgi:AraC family transcriptional regulator
VSVETIGAISDHCPGGQRIRWDRWPGIACSEMLYPCDFTLEAHAHKAALFSLSMDGAYCDSAEGERFQCGPRAVVFQPAGQSHTITVGDHALRAFVVQLEDDVDGHDSSGGGQVTRLREVRALHADGGPLASILSALYCELRCPDDCSELAAQGLVLQLIATANRLSRPVVEEARRPPWLDRAAELLHDRFRSRLTLSEISAAVGVPPARLSMAFRRAFRRTLGEEQRRLRIEFATGRLCDSTTSLAAIALEAGFSDQAHFSRAFRDATGTTPARYRTAMSA